MLIWRASPKLALEAVREHAQREMRENRSMDPSRHKLRSRFRISGSTSASTRATDCIFFIPQYGRRERDSHHLSLMVPAWKGV